MRRIGPESNKISWTVIFRHDVIDNGTSQEVLVDELRVGGPNVTISITEQAPLDDYLRATSKEQAQLEEVFEHIVDSNLLVEWNPVSLGGLGTSIDLLGSNCLGYRVICRDENEDGRLLNEDGRLLNVISLERQESSDPDGDDGIEIGPAGDGGNDGIDGTDLDDDSGGNDGGGGSDQFIFQDGFDADAEKVDVSGVTNLVDIHLQTDAAAGDDKILDGANPVLLTGITDVEIGVALFYSDDDFLF